MDPPQPSPKSNAGEEPPDANADDKPTQALRKLATDWKFITGFLLTVGAGFWARYGDSTAGLCLLILGLCAGLFLVAHKIFKTRLWRYGLPAVLSACVVGGTVLVLVTKKMGQPEMEPQLQLVLRSAQFPTHNLWLTNKPLFQVPKLNSAVISEMMLVFPVTSNDATVTLSLAVMNAAQNITIDGFLVTVLFAEDLEVTKETFSQGGWRETAQAISDTRALIIKQTDKVYPQTGHALHDIGLKFPGGWPTRLCQRCSFLE